MSKVFYDKTIFCSHHKLSDFYAIVTWFYYAFQQDF